MQKGQVGVETIIGAVIFMLFFLGITSYLFAQDIEIEDKILEMEKEKQCKELSQILFAVKNNSLTWSGELDNNFYINDNSILVNYSPPTPFSGVYCDTLSTGTINPLYEGDVNISYTLNGGFSFAQ